jgi:hypothetical protein
VEYRLLVYTEKKENVFLSKEVTEGFFQRDFSSAVIVLSDKK